MTKKATQNIATNPNVDMQWGLRRAQREHWDIIEPKDNELQLDLDGARALRAYGLQFSILRRAGLTKGWRERVRPSKKSGHTHVTIAMQPEGWALRFDTMTLVLKVALQAVLGSDPRREAFNLCRVLNGNKYPIVFFEGR